MSSKIDDGHSLRDSNYADSSGYVQHAATGLSSPRTPGRHASFSSSHLNAQKKMFPEFHSFQKLLEPSLPQRPGIAPYRIVLGDVREKVDKSHCHKYCSQIFISNLSPSRINGNFFFLIGKISGTQKIKNT